MKRREKYINSSFRCLLTCISVHWDEAFWGRALDDWRHHSRKPKGHQKELLYHRSPFTHQLQAAATRT